jgi:predicted DNA-binding transcriptional regulator YafY
VHFAYVARDGSNSMRAIDPSAVVYSGRYWYVVAFDLDRDDWRTFRIDRIDSTLRLGGRGQSRTVPGGDAAAYLQSQLRRQHDGAEVDAAPGRIRVLAPAERIRSRVPQQYATVESDGCDADGRDVCVVQTRGSWSRHTLMWIAMLDEPIEVLGPPDLIDAARKLAGRLSAGVGGEA